MQLQKPIFFQIIIFKLCETHHSHNLYFALHSTVVIAVHRFFHSLCYFMVDGAEFFIFLVN